MRFAPLVFLAACHAAAPVSPDLAAVGAPGLHAIDAARLEATTRYLAQDALGGRAPGSPGGERAEAYIAEQFAAAGLEPAGEHGTYFQIVPLREATRDDARTSLVVHARGGDITLAAPNEALLFADPRSADVTIDAPLVFVGYGFSSHGYDDLAGLDLHGAIAVVFGGAPREIDGRALDTSEHAVMSDTKRRTIALREHGASAMLVIFDPARAKRMPYETWVTKVIGSSLGWLDERGHIGSRPVLPNGVLGARGFDRVLAATVGTTTTTNSLWAELDRGRAVKLDLGVTASLRIHAELAERRARNVLGMLRGRDPALAAETVVFTAHSDHLGIGPPVAGDTIYNGALDDAIGVAGIVEIAHAFAALPQRPRRSILFVAVTGEEKGLLGSDYFVAHPTIPLDRIVADINIDGLNPLYESFDMVALGAEHSTLLRDADAAARATGYLLSPDPDPDQVYFIRSDQYSFVLGGIPSAFPGPGWRDARGGIEANKRVSDAWGEQHYHLPSDEWRAEYSGAWAAKEAGFDFIFGLSVANATERPRWNPGDAFSNMMSRSATPAVPTVNPR